MSSEQKQNKQWPWWQGPRGEGYVIIQFILFGVLFFAPGSLPGWTAWPQPWSTIAAIAGLALGAAGALLIAAGLLSLGRNLTAVPHPKDDAHMVQKGAYHWVRHPIYSGICLGAFGWALLQNAPLTLLYALILFLFFDVKSRREEQWLRARYPAYSSYQQRVSRLIPFLY